ncbi:hypothetical protein [Paracidovorax valerianellae]|uniref:Uncharacterized protein n=1 Tax=Paracidovorax valerianellae TaxID=187868 RepID=A0A1G7FQJ5_9BURK|nr:hypothetical protein [Paracidovorax valerianellae]MDA8447841.1 hypothetical protein [Paracidovorax valerianellae]SDE78122.1 hypothetical protein SAMN05192589_1413 [Paracidovorax valerianellae]
MFVASQVRKALVWTIPLFLGITAVSFFVVLYGLVPPINAIASNAPVVRIAPASQVAPFVAAFCLIGIVVGIMRAVPCSDRRIKPYEFAFKIAVVAALVAMVLIPVTSIGQRFYMPRLGYSLCSELEGNPTMWFTDWVRNPAWCVGGKSLEWVSEQAAIKD